jgi:hypothetical protein
MVYHPVRVRVRSCPHEAEAGAVAEDIRHYNTTILHIHYPSRNYNFTTGQLFTLSHLAFPRRTPQAFLHSATSNLQCLKAPLFLLPFHEKNDT